MAGTGAPGHEKADEIPGPAGNTSGRRGRGGRPCRQAAGEKKKGAAEECLQGHGEEFATFFRFFKKAGLVCFSSAVNGKAAEADAFREMFPALGEECLPLCVFRFLRLIILPLSCGGESREVTKREK